MAWYLMALIVGLIAPWIVFGVQLRSVVEEGGIVNVFGIWFGLSLITVLAMLALWGSVSFSSDFKQSSSIAATVA
jgi:hypothetical protein